MYIIIIKDRCWRKTAPQERSLPSLADRGDTGGERRGEWLEKEQDETAEKRASPHRRCAMLTLTVPPAVSQQQKSESGGSENRASGSMRG